jgi:hypothetical protein
LLQSHPSTRIDDCDQQSRDISVRQGAVEQRRSLAVGPAINQFSSRPNCLKHNLFIIMINIYMNDLSVKEIKISMLIHQSSNNDLLVLYPNRQITVSIEPINNHTRREIFYIDVDQNQQIIELVIQGIVDSNTMFDSQDCPVSTAFFEIENIWINQILIEKWAASKIYKFFPKYSESQINYARENNSNLEQFLQDEYQFYFNGSWQLNIEDFFVKYHFVLTNGLLKYNYWVREGHLGIVDDCKLLQLKKIIDSL